jgi:hypothetical protein
MRALLAGLVATAALLPTPVAAVDSGHMSFGGNHGVTIHHGGHFGDRDRDHRRRHHDNDGAFLYDYDREYQGDTVWRSDSFHDWWHDRPDRAYPHWMLSNQNCDKQWYQGDMLRC